jgi:predicted PurR-regulated permease PerM
MVELKNFLSSDRVKDFYVSLPDRIKSLYAWFSVPDSVNDYVDSLLKDPKWLEQAGVKTLTVVRGFLGMATQRMGALFVAVSSSMFTIILMPIIAYYILLEYDHATESVFRIIPARFRDDTKNILNQVQIIFSSFFRGQMMVCAVIAVLMSIGLGIIGLPYAIIIGILAGAANIVPYLGAIVGILLSFVTAFLSFPAKDFLLMALYIIIVYSIIQLLDNLLLSPKIIGDSVNLHPLIIMFVLMAGAFIADFSGMIFAVPVAASARTVWQMYGPDLDKL